MQPLRTKHKPQQRYEIKFNILLKKHVVAIRNSCHTQHVLVTHARHDTARLNHVRHNDKNQKIFTDLNNPNHL